MWRSVLWVGLALGATALADRRAGGYAPYPEPDSGYVTDHAGLLSDDQEERLERKLWQVESRSNVEVIVVTIRSMAQYPGTASGGIEAFARGLYDSYGIGNLPRNDGVLLLVSLDDGKARIELGARYGDTRNADAARIMRNVIIPAFHQKDFPGGIDRGVDAIAREFAGVEFGFPWRLVVLIGGALAAAAIGVSLIANGKRGWGWVFVGLAIVLLLFALRVLLAILTHMPRTASRGWAPGGRGGFGGGFSGGGGATGSF